MKRVSFLRTGTVCDILAWGNSPIISNKLIVDLDFLHGQSRHLQIIIVLFSPFQYLCPYFFLSYSTYQLRTPMQCLIIFLIVGILVLKETLLMQSHIEKLFSLLFFSGLRYLFLPLFIKFLSLVFVKFHQMFCLYLLMITFFLC